MKIKALFSVLLAGRELSKPGAWKKAQVWGNLLTGIVALLSVVYGHQIPLLEEDALLIGGAIAALINIYLVYATSKKVGLPNHEIPPIDLVSRSVSDSERVRQSEVLPAAKGSNESQHRSDGFNG